MTIQEYAYAKLNLSLDVTAKREDGYHDMLMVMQTVSVGDRIEIEQERQNADGDGKKHKVQEVHIYYRFSAPEQD